MSSDVNFCLPMHKTSIPIEAKCLATAIPTKPVDPVIIAFFIKKLYWGPSLSWLLCPKKLELRSFRWICTLPRRTVELATIEGESLTGSSFCSDWSGSSDEKCFHVCSVFRLCVGIKSLIGMWRRASSPPNRCRLVFLYLLLAYLCHLSPLFPSFMPSQCLAKCGLYVPLSVPAKLRLSLGAIQP